MVANVCHVPYDVEVPAFEQISLGRKAAAVRKTARGTL